MGQTAGSNAGVLAQEAGVHSLPARAAMQPLSASIRWSSRLPSSCQDAKPPDVNEILLLDSQGGVLEGMSSNVFVVTDGRVVTPEKGILVGTVRNLVLEVGTGNMDVHDDLVPHNNDLRKWTLWSMRAV